MPEAALSDMTVTGARSEMLEAAFEAARSALSNGDLTGALAIYTELRVVFPETSAPYLQAARALAGRFRFEEADILLEAAAARFPDDEAVMADFAAAAANLGDRSTAADRWAGALERFPRSPTILCGAAAALRDAGRFAAAGSYFQTAESLFPADPEPGNGLARLALTRGDSASALARWTILRARFPDFLEAYTGAAEAMAMREMFAEAENLLADAMVRFPNALEPSAAHAGLAAMRRDWSEASRRWERLRDDHPDHAEGYVGLAAVWRDLGQFDAADAVLMEALVRLPDHIDLLTAYAGVADARGDRREAVVRWEHVRRLFPGHPIGFVNGLAALMAVGREPDADTLAIDAQYRFPGNPDVAVAYAALAENAQDWDRALMRWQRASQRFADTIAVHLGVARVLRGLNRSAEAEAGLRAAAARFPDHPEPLRELAGLVPVEEGAAIWDAIHARFPWLFDPGPDAEPLRTLPQYAVVTATSRSEPMRVAVAGYHLAHQVSLLLSRTVPLRDRLSVQWINVGMEADAIQSRLPDKWLGGTAFYFEEAMVGHAATKRALRAELPGGCEIRTFPTATLWALWPFAGRDERLVPEPPVYNGGRYVDTDTIAASLVNPAVTDDDLFDLYMEISNGRVLDMDALLAADLARLRSEEQGIDVKLAPFVESNFHAYRLFATPHERCTPIVKEIVRQLLSVPAVARVCDLDVALAGLDRLTMGWRAYNRAFPVHPRVARHFGLTWWSPDMTYELGRNDFAFRDYMIRYMRWSPWLG